jgi:hypothetical protein
MMLESATFNPARPYLSIGPHTLRFFPDDDTWLIWTDDGEILVGSGLEILETARLRGGTVYQGQQVSTAEIAIVGDAQYFPPSTCEH